MADPTYTGIQRPYDDIMHRQDDLSYVLGSPVTPGSENGSVEEVAIKTGGSIADVWIRNKIASENWKPKKVGFLLNGQTGYAEFTDVYVAGAITALSGTIGGWTIGTSELSSGSVKIQSTAERILMGAATAELTGSGIFIGKNGANYAFRVGDPAGSYMDWTGSALDVVGGTITGSLIQTASSGERIEIKSSTKRMNLINSSGSTVLSMNYGTSSSTAILTIHPANDARGSLYITSESGNNSTTVDIADSGTGISLKIYKNGNARPVEVSNLGNAAGISILQDNSTSLNHGMYILARPDTTSFTNASGLFIDLGSSSVGNGLYIEDPTSNSTTSPLKINRGGSNASDISGAKITVTNATGRAVGVDLSGTAYAFKFATDTTAAGAYKGRIPIVAGTVTQYLHYYDA